MFVSSGCDFLPMNRVDTFTQIARVGPFRSYIHRLLGLNTELTNQAVGGSHLYLVWLNTNPNRMLCSGKKGEKIGLTGQNYIDTPLTCRLSFTWYVDLFRTQRLWTTNSVWYVGTVAVVHTTSEGSQWSILHKSAWEPCCCCICIDPVPSHAANYVCLVPSRGSALAVALYIVRHANRDRGRRREE